MSDQRYTDEFKVEAVRQITEHGYSVQDVAQRLGVSSHSLYLWRKKYGNEEASAEHLRAELKRITEERDILKKATAYFA